MTRSEMFSLTIGQTTSELRNILSGRTFHYVFSSSSNVSQMFISWLLPSFNPYQLFHHWIQLQLLHLWYLW